MTTGRRLKFLADIWVSNVDKLTIDGELPVLLCNYTDVYHNALISESLPFMSATATKDQIVNFTLRSGDVLFTKDSESPADIAVPAYVPTSLPGVVCGYHLAIARPDQTKVTGRYLYWVMASSLAQSYFATAATGVTRFGLRQDVIGDFVVPIPPIDRQAAIAGFLTQEADRLDALVREKQDFVQLLTEKRAALISHAVTKGLNSDALLRDTGVPWLGDIPAHWSVVRAKDIFAEVDQRSEAGDEEMLSVSHLTGVTRRADKNVNMFEAESNEGAKLCWPGDLVINTLWAWMGAMGISPLHGVVSPAYHVYRPSAALTPAYVELICRTAAFVKEVTRYSKGVWSSRLRLYPEGFFEVLVPVPPAAEQHQIAETVRHQTGHIDELVCATLDSVLLLKERRSALISAAVTGRLNLGTGAEMPTVELVGASCGF
jgi:type I restriction enzyme, S subunit